MDTTTTILGTDGLKRCPWSAEHDIYRHYHDTEWGRALHGTTALFERLSLEAFQSGLSWITILRKRDAFRTAFDHFSIPTVAIYSDKKIEELLNNADIIRNRAKIYATIHNAQTILDLDTPLDELIWSFAPPTKPRPASTATIPAITDESTALAKNLKKRGFKFIGPTTAYALMQAVGMVDDHLKDCHVPPNSFSPQQL